MIRWYVFEVIAKLLFRSGRTSDTLRPLLNVFFLINKSSESCWKCLKVLFITNNSFHKYIFWAATPESIFRDLNIGCDEWTRQRSAKFSTDKISDSTGKIIFTYSIQSYFLSKLNELFSFSNMKASKSFEYHSYKKVFVMDGHESAVDKTLVLSFP